MKILTRKEIKAELLWFYETLYTGDEEACIREIETILFDNPDCVEMFVSLFSSESDLTKKVILAKLILSTQKYEPAVEFLKREGSF